MDIDEIQDLQDKMADQQANVEERQQVFADIAANDMEECQEELDELEMLQAQQDMDDVVVSQAPIAGQNVPVAQPAQAAPAMSEEEKELAELQQMMA